MRNHQFALPPQQLQHNDKTNPNRAEPNHVIALKHYHYHQCPSQFDSFSTFIGKIIKFGHVSRGLFVEAIGGHLHSNSRSLIEKQCNSIPRQQHQQQLEKHEFQANDQM